MSSIGLWLCGVNRYFDEIDSGCIPETTSPTGEDIDSGVGRLLARAEGEC